MKPMGNNLPPPDKMLADAGAQVKARVISAGLKLSALAGASGIAPSTLTHYLTGYRKNVGTQVRIVRAFRRLTNTRISYSDFWGDLWDRDCHAA